jgi:hypothetical protein
MVTAYRGRDNEGGSMARLVLALAVLATAASAAAAPMPLASTFSARVTNPWFPLRAGTRYVYTGVKDGKPTRDVVTVTHSVVTIDGIPSVAVHDRLYVAGHLGERTTDWYSQDAKGNVWYLGENTAELDAQGRVTTTEGTWRSGVGGAKAGIFMPAHPRIGESGVQEHKPGVAEDHFRVIARFGTNAVLTEEWTPLEPGVLDHKLYVRGVGTVLEQTERGGDERNELVSLTHRG